MHAVRVLELGSGSGLVGLAAAFVLSKLLKDLKSSHRVELILSDFHPDVLLNLERNVEQNRLAFQDSRLHVRVEKLDWTDLDNSRVKGKFDVVLGSDLVYDEIHAWCVLQISLALGSQTFVTAGSQTR